MADLDKAQAAEQVTILNKNSWQLFQEGRLKEAMEHAKQSYDIVKQYLAEEHPEYTKSLNTLAIIYKDTGDYQAAESLFKQSLQIRKRVLGEEHRDYASNLNHLASLYAHVGNYQAADSLYQQSAKIFKKVLGENHPD